jgi:hypothetical protein
MYQRGINRIHVLFLTLCAVILFALPTFAQAEIIYIGAGALGANTLTTDATAAVPANTIENDILLVHAWTRSTADTTIITGFTEIAQVDTTNASHRWFWKRHDGTEATVTCDHDQSADNYCQMFAFRGADSTGNPWNALGTPQADNGTGDPTSFTAISTATANSMVVVFAGYQDDDATVGVMTGTDPSAYTEVYAESATGSDGAITMGYALRTAAGSTGTISYNYGTIAARTAAGDEGSLVLSLEPEPISGPQYACAGALGANTTTADATAAVPSCATTNDVLIIHAWTRSTSDTTTVSEFTEFAQVDTTTGSHRWFWKRHDGSESTATCDHNQSADNYCRMFAFRAVVTSGNPWNTLGTPASDGGTGDPTSHTAITTGYANSLVVIFAGYEDNDNTVPSAITSTDPAAYNEDWATSATGSDGSIEMGFATRSAAGSTGSISIDYGTIAARTAAGDEGSLVLSLAPIPVAPTVTTDAASNVTGTDATLNGTLSDTGGANGTVRGFAWGTNSTLSNGDTATTTENGTFSSPGSFSTSVSLASLTAYYFRAYVTNSAGTSFGSILNLTSLTSENIPLPRTLRLFEGFRLQLAEGRMIIYPKD